VHPRFCGRGHAIRGVILQMERDRMTLTRREMKALMTAEAEAIIGDLLGDEAGEQGRRAAGEKGKVTGCRFERSHV
jgi:hypothetical protein